MFCFRISVLHRSHHSAAACVSADQMYVGSRLCTALFVCTDSYQVCGDKFLALRLREFLIWQINAKSICAFGSQPKNWRRDHRTIYRSVTA
jgi:hypothetical protein